MVKAQHLIYGPKPMTNRTARLSLDMFARALIAASLVNEFTGAFISYLLNSHSAAFAEVPALFLFWGLLGCYRYLHSYPHRGRAVRRLTARCLAAVLADVKHAARVLIGVVRIQHG